MSEQTQNLFPEKVVSLLTKNYFIKSYQRGYRWNESQVSDLLNDVNNFDVSRRSHDTWYCLQPLVVKKMSDADVEKHKLTANEIWYEVIDGQQRLTTLFLIMHYANEMWVGKSKDPEPRIRYQTRGDSESFLANIVVGGNDEVEINKSNIDFCHISKAYKAIHTWAKDMKSKQFDNNGFQSKIKEHTKVIWYEVASSEESIDVFTRLNMGKIRLTNAELVKALLLSQDSISSDSEEELRLKRLEIATEWDAVENQLNDIGFWSFVTNEMQSSYSSKIELLLELAVGRANLGDEFGVFNRFFDLWNDKKNIKELWEDNIISNFEILKEWYNDHDLYHLIGYLVDQNHVTIGSLLKTYKKEGSTKEGFLKKFIKEEISNSLKSIDITSIEYSENSDHPKIHRILTLFNILTIKNTDGNILKYPFSLHKNNGYWSLEHIHAQSSKGLNTVEQWTGWLNAHYNVLKESNESSWKELAQEIRTNLDDGKIKEETFENLFERVHRLMSSDNDLNDLHGLENMALLNVADNSALSNATFAVKRQRILEMDKAGSYIPICTRNVFLKYYNKNADDFIFWSPLDRDTYMSEIRKVLHNYLPDTTQNTNTI